MSESENIRDPANYRKLMEPHASVEALSTAWSEFFKETRELRNKHGLTDVTLVCATNFIDAQKESTVIVCGHIGDPSKSDMMLAYALGRMRVERHAELDKASGIQPPATTKEVNEIAAKTAKQFPHGKVDPADKGRFRYQVTANPTAQIVRIDFGSPVTAVGLTLAEVDEMIESLTAAAWELRGVK